MAYNLIIKSGAQADAVTAYLYYEDKQNGLGSRFLDALSDQYRKLEKDPQLYSFVHADKENTLRDIKVGKFPYLIVFEISGNMVTIYAILNTYQERSF
jgi:hypothetical protein